VLHSRWLKCQNFYLGNQPSYDLGGGANVFVETSFYGHSDVLVTLLSIFIVFRGILRQCLYLCSALFYVLLSPSTCPVAQVREELHWITGF
jgi:hypothetical protein